ncbi:MAG: hypothetical protein RL532_1090, partial [Actinomycetota bacterium]
MFAGIGLRDEQVVGINTNCSGVDRVKRMLSVDIGTDAAVALGLGDNVHGERRLTRRLGAEDLDHATARHTTHAEGDIKWQGARRHGLDGHRLFFAHAHDRTSAELLVDLPEGGLECFGALGGTCAI